MSQNKTPIEALLDEARQLTFGQSAHRPAKKVYPMELPDFEITDSQSDALIEPPLVTELEFFYWEQSTPGTFSLKSDRDASSSRG